MKNNSYGSTNPNRIEAPKTDGPKEESNLGRLLLLVFVIFVAFIGLVFSGLMQKQENYDVSAGEIAVIRNISTGNVAVKFGPENYDYGLKGMKVYNSTAVGINYFPEKNIKLQASYVWANVDRFLAQVQVSF